MTDKKREYFALCWLLRAADAGPEAEAEVLDFIEGQRASMQRVFPYADDREAIAWPDIGISTREDSARVVALVTRLARWLADPRSDYDEIRAWDRHPIGNNAFRLTPVGSSVVTNAERRLLSQLAGYPDRSYPVFPGEPYASSPYELLVLAARALYSVANGECELRRCPAPAAGIGGSECRRWFLSGGKAGPRQQYCSGACRTRAHRLRARM